MFCSYCVTQLALHNPQCTWVLCTTPLCFTLLVVSNARGDVKHMKICMGVDFFFFFCGLILKLECIPVYQILT